LSAIVFTPETNSRAPATISNSEIPVWTNVGQFGEAADHGRHRGRGGASTPHR
jgi:hypothetical protein